MTTIFRQVRKHAASMSSKGNAEGGGGEVLIPAVMMNPAFVTDECVIDCPSCAGNMIPQSLNKYVLNVGVIVENIAQMTRIKIEDLTTNQKKNAAVYKAFVITDEEIQKIAELYEGCEAQWSYLLGVLEENKGKYYAILYAEFDGQILEPDYQTESVRIWTSDSVWTSIPCLYALSIESLRLCCK